MALTRPPARIRKRLRRMVRSVLRAKSRCNADKIMALMSEDSYTEKKLKLDKLKRATLEMGFYLKPKETQEKATVENDQLIKDDPMTEDDSMLEDDSEEDSSTAHGSDIEKLPKSDENKKEGEHEMGAMDGEASSDCEDSSEEFCTDMETDTESESSESEDYQDDAMETYDDPEEESSGPPADDPYCSYALTARPDNEGAYTDTEKDNKNDSDNEIKNEHGTQTENEAVNDSPNSEEMMEEITEGQPSPEPTAQHANTDPGAMTVRVTGMTAKTTHDSDTDSANEGDELPAIEEAKSTALVLKLPHQARQVGMRPASTMPSYCSSSSDYDQSSEDSPAELLVRVSSHDFKPAVLRDEYKRQKTWSIERHIQWTWGYENAPWKTERQLCRTLKVKSAYSLRRGIWGAGNIRLNKEYCTHDSKSYDWGRPAHCLQTGIVQSGKPTSWLWQGQARELLIALEDFYFSLDQDEQDALAENAFQWWQFRDFYSPLGRLFGSEVVEMFEQAGKGSGADAEGEN
ncbi:hypothetical protein N7454_003201 [Penicillium verhagenii]|nr:hypothetical protein N7454_003201 [Penicillium verhagenii]